MPIKTQYILIFFSALVTFAARSLEDNKESAQIEKIEEKAFAALEGSKQDGIDWADSLISLSKQDGGIYLINGYTIKGILLKNQGFYVSSLNQHLLALKEAERIQDKGRISACLSNIGSIYVKQENYAEAAKYFQTSLAIEEELKNPQQKSIRLFNIGEAYFGMDSLTAAFTMFSNSFLIEESLNNKTGEFYAKLGLLKVYLKMGKISEAAVYLEELDNSIAVADFEVSVEFIIQKAEFLRLNGQLKESLEELGIAEKQAVGEELKSTLLEILKVKIQVLKAAKMYEQLATCYSDYVALLHELQGNKVMQQLADLNFNYELERRNERMRELSEERDRAIQDSLEAEEISAYESRLIGYLIVNVALVVGLVLYGSRRIINR